MPRLLYQMALTKDQGEAIKRLHVALINSRSRLDSHDERLVKHDVVMDAVRWMIDQLVKAV